MKTDKMFNYPTNSKNCARCKRGKHGFWKFGLLFVKCKKGKLLDPKNPEHYEKCPWFKERK